jgi:hypothetical protein
MAKRKRGARGGSRRRYTWWTIGLAGIVAAAAIATGGNEDSGRSTETRVQAPVETSEVRSAPTLSLDATAVPTLAVRGEADTDDPTATRRQSNQQPGRVVPSATDRPTERPAPTDEPDPTDVPTEAPTIAARRDTYYAVGSGANLRSNPNTEGSPVEQIAVGGQIVIVGEARGQVVEGSDLWYLVDYEGQQLYVHSSVVSASAPAAAPVVVQPANPPGGQPMNPVSPAPVSPFGCNGIDDLNCSDFRAIGQNANAHLAACGDEDNLDGEDDGRACE